MSTVVSQSTGQTGNVNLPDLRWSTAEKALWERCKPHVAAKTGIWIEATYDYLYRNGGAGDSVAGFQIVDRIGGRRFKAGFGERHPVVVTDSISDRPCLAFGAGGMGENVLSDFANGSLECPSILSLGQEINRLPLTGPGVGASYAFAIRVPDPSTTANGIAFGSVTGGALMAGSADGDASPILQVAYDNGKMVFRTSIGGAFIASDLSVKTGDWVTGVVTYDHVAQTARIWLEAAEATPTVLVSSFIGDFSANANARLPRIGTRGATAETDSDRFIGFIGFLFFVASPILNDETARAEAFAVANEKVSAGGEGLYEYYTPGEIV